MKPENVEGGTRMIKKRSCQDEIPVLGTTVGNFWSWAYSDILSNTDLIREPSSFRQEVVIHELLHLRVANHGRVFKALLRAYLAEVDKVRDVG